MSTERQCFGELKKMLDDLEKRVKAKSAELHAVQQELRQYENVADSLWVMKEPGYCGCTRPHIYHWQEPGTERAAAIWRVFKNEYGHNPIGVFYCRNIWVGVFKGADNRLTSVTSDGYIYHTNIRVRRASAALGASSTGTEHSGSRLSKTAFDWLYSQGEKL